VNNQTPTINIFEKAARKAGKNLIRDFGEIENLQIESKSIGDFVTNADLNAEKAIYETLKYYYPDTSYYMEEKGLIEGNKNEMIVIDPLDGTTNFIHGIPIFGVVIAKIVNNDVTDGIIFNPITNEFYWASKGMGAWCNNNRLRVSKRQNFIECVIGSGIPHHKRAYEGFLDEINQISKECSGLRRLGSAALDLAYVASGKLDAYWEKNLNLWDVAAGVLLVREAGGKITEPSGKIWSTKSKDILASNTNIHEKLQKLLEIKK
tara:strand:+ start:123 stop:911 length:789 start_codon:yes stop_codon:yes gene_type:complete